MKKNFTTNLKQNFGQGTIEYLVILAIIIVISLIVVSMMVGMFDSQDIIIKNDKLGNMIGTGGISITESMIDIDGDGALSIKNNSGDTLTITQISTTNTNLNFNNTPISNSTTKIFSLDNLDLDCACTEGKPVSCTVTITFRTSKGVTHTKTLKLSSTCQQDTPNQVSTETPLLCPTYTGLQNKDGNLIVCDCNDLQNMNQNLTANYLLGQDINCSNTLTWNDNTGFIPIGTYSTPFTGNFNGNNFTLTNLYINRPTTSYVGLFGSTNNSTIQNIGLINNTVTGAGSVGGIAGYSNFTTINNTFTTGNLTSTGINNSGGLIGHSWNTTITNCYTTGNIGGMYTIGGIIGYAHQSSITNTYSTGTISGTYQKGGIVGYLYSSTIQNSYSIGTNPGSSEINGLVGTPVQANISNSYWDIYLTGQSNCNEDSNAGCTPTNNQESNYYGITGIPMNDNNLNWDPTIWTARDNNHPILAWQN
jgi:hypothetical protein